VCFLKRKLYFQGGYIVKRLFLIIGFVLILLVGCNNAGDKFTITTDRNSYTPSMSSAQGIKMTPNFKTKKSFEDLIYHWETTEGEFIDIGKEVKNQGGSVVWSAVENDKVADINKSFDIKLEVIDSESKKTVAATKLTIMTDNGFYKIKK
jgi:hypothetical protein